LGVFFQAEDGIRDWSVTGVQTCALPIYTMCRFSLRRWRSGIEYRASVMRGSPARARRAAHDASGWRATGPVHRGGVPPVGTSGRSEEHTSELQSLTNLVCRLLLENKNTP